MTTVGPTRRTVRGLSEDHTPCTRSSSFAPLRWPWPAASDAGANLGEVVHDDVSPTKRTLDVPAEVWSCHTTAVEGDVIEGRVPAAAIADLLESRPDIDGIARHAPGLTGHAWHRRRSVEDRRIR